MATPEHIFLDDGRKWRELRQWQTARDYRARAGTRHISHRKHASFFPSLFLSLLPPPPILLIPPFPTLFHAVSPFSLCILILRFSLSVFIFLRFVFLQPKFSISLPRLPFLYFHVSIIRDLYLTNDFSIDLEFLSLNDKCWSLLIVEWWKCKGSKKKMCRRFATLSMALYSYAAFLCIYWFSFVVNLPSWWSWWLRYGCLRNKWFPFVCTASVYNKDLKFEFITRGLRIILFLGTKVFRKAAVTTVLSWIASVSNVNKVHS